MFSIWNVVMIITTSDHETKIKKLKTVNIIIIANMNMEHDQCKHIVARKKKQTNSIEKWWYRSTVSTSFDFSFFSSIYKPQYKCVSHSNLPQPEAQVRK